MQRQRQTLPYIMWTIWALFVGGLVVGGIIFASEMSGKNSTPAVKKVTVNNSGINGLKTFEDFTNKSEKIGRQISGQLAQAATSIQSSIIDPIAEINAQLLKHAVLSIPRSVGAEVKAESFVVGDIESGEIMAQRRPEIKYPIASITKVITAVVALEEIPPESSILITGSAIDVSTNSAKLKKGERIMAKDLLYPLLMTSSNAAAEALAIHYDRRDFISKMNEKAVSIGAWDTKFTDPSGLSQNNISTAADLFLITKWIHDYEPSILGITAERLKQLNKHTWTNKTHFLNLSSFVGGKIGFTDEAMKTATTIFELKDSMGKDRLVAIIVLKSSNRDKDVLTLLNYVKNSYGLTE
ncbi:MAG: serine hydrolase [bacterium]